MPGFSRAGLLGQGLKVGSVCSVVPTAFEKECINQPYREFPGLDYLSAMGSLASNHTSSFALMFRSRFCDIPTLSRLETKHSEAICPHSSGSSGCFFLASGLRAWGFMFLRCLRFFRVSLSSPGNVWHSTANAFQRKVFKQIFARLAVEPCSVRFGCFFNPLSPRFPFPQHLGIRTMRRQAEVLLLGTKPVQPASQPAIK